MVPRYLKSLAVFVLVALFFCLAPLTGCGGGGGGGGGSASGGGGGGGSSAGAVQVTVPFTGSTNPDGARADLANVSYYLVDLYQQGTTNAVATQQQVNKPSSGTTGSCTFSSVTAGNYTVGTKGYDASNILIAWSSSDVTVSGGSTATVTVSPGTSPTGYTMNKVNLTNGAATVALNSFGSSNEAMIFVNYNSANFDNNAAYSSIIDWKTQNNPVTATTAVTGIAESLNPLAKLTGRKAAKPEPEELDLPLRDIDFITENTVKCLRQHGIPKPLTKQQLAARGPKAVVGDPKNLNIQDNNGVWHDGQATTCRAANTHCAVWVQNSDWLAGTVTQQRVDAIASFFNSTIWPKMEEIFGTVAALRWGGVQFNVVISSWVVDNAFFDATHEYTTAQYAHSNQLDSVYCATSISIGSLTATDEDWQGIVAHEFQHYMRWYEKVYNSGYTSASDNQLGIYSTADSPLNEGMSQYFECYVGRGFLGTNNFSIALRSSDIKNYLEFSERTALVTRGGKNRYAAGFMMVFYLLDHYGGVSALQKMSLADGKLALDSVQVAAGENYAEVFRKYCMALNLAAKSGMVSAYTFTSVDLTGNTTYYNNTLHPSWYYDSNVNDYSLGIDMQTAGNTYNLTPTVIEWAPEQYRFYNGRGQTLTINLSNFNPNAQGGGSFTIYALNK